MQPGQFDRGDDVGGQPHLAAEAAAHVDGSCHDAVDGHAEAFGGELGGAFHGLGGHLQVEGAVDPLGQAGVRLEGVCVCAAVV